MPVDDCHKQFSIVSQQTYFGNSTPAALIPDMAVELLDIFVAMKYLFIIYSYEEY